MAGQVARILEVGNASCKTLVRILQGKNLHAIPKREFLDNIKLDLKEIWYVCEWNNLAQDRDRGHAALKPVSNSHVP